MKGAIVLGVLLLAALCGWLLPSLLHALFSFWHYLTLL